VCYSAFVIKAFHCENPDDIYCPGFFVYKLNDVCYDDHMNTEIICPICGYYCLGKGGLGCIDKPNEKERKMFNDLKLEKEEEENYGGLPEEGRKLLTEARDEIGEMRLKIKELEEDSIFVGYQKKCSKT